MTELRLDFGDVRGLARKIRHHRSIRRREGMIGLQAQFAALETVRVAADQA